METAVDPDIVTGRRLGAWARIWRYLVVVLTSLLSYAAFYGALVIAADPRTAPSGVADDVAAELAPALLVMGIVDPLIGIVAICLLPLRRRHPLAIALATGAASCVSVMSAPAAVLAAVSLATHRRPIPILLACPPWLLASYVFERIAPDEIMAHTPWWASVVWGGLFYALWVAIGLYVGARRALIASFHDRAVKAERERELQVAAAQAGERTRIAREMHDVLAHRISLVAMHAGALAYREDLDRRETARTAALIQQNARHALTELRQVLGVLRAQDAGVEPPQPTLARLPALIEEARAAGAAIEVRDALASDPPELVSRTAYRVVQEGLTNARKHAPGAPIRVRVDGHPGGLLTVEVRNGAAAPHAGAPAIGGAGAGLAGLAERVELAQGTLEHGPSGAGFVLGATLPWETEEDDA